MAVAWAVAACLPDNPSDDTGTTDDTTGGPAQGGAVLGCPSGRTCTVVIASQTLDDRVEIFAPDDPDGVVYRGAIDLDLKPNECQGCGLGDYGGDRLDEPFGVTLTADHLSVILGHYPSPELGTLVSFPLSFFGDREAGNTIARSEFFAGGQFDGVQATPLEQLEPIFIHRWGDKLLVSVFNNNLFQSEDGWTQPGRLLVFDAADPGAGFAIRDLDDLEGGACAGAAQIVTVADGTLALACDGNEGIAFLSGAEPTGASVDEVAAGLQGTMCQLPSATSGRRVRYLAPDGVGGALVAEGGGATLLGGARLWTYDAACAMQGFAMLPDEDWQLGQVALLPGTPETTWLLASGAATATGHRGIHVVQGGSSLQVCGLVAGFDESFVDGSGAALEPFALAPSRDGSHLAVGVAPLAAPMSGPGYGKVLWAELSGLDDPCTLSAEVTDLTAGGSGAPEVDAADASTFRRAPLVVELFEVQG
jgi:hypothetical protein